MRNLEFAKRIRLRCSWLYEEIYYKQKLKQTQKTLKEYLDEIEKIIIQVLDQNNKFIPTEAFIESLQTHKITLIREIETINRHIGYCNNRIRHYQQICNYYYPLG